MILVNGGAVIALLAFVGALETGGNGTTIEFDALVAPIRWFALGVGFAAVTATLAYLVNLLDGYIFASFRLTWEHPYVHELQEAKRLKVGRRILYVAALASAVASLVAFFLGIVTVTSAISQLGV